MALRFLAIYVALVGAADPSQPHPHQGLLGKYERGPPSSIGMGKLDATTEQLRSGSPVLKLLELPGGWKRSISVQDVNAAESVVWSAINDLPRYPKMVEGVIACDVYSKESKSGQQITCATYKLAAAGFKLEYFMKHIFEPSKHCMTFHLDYDRNSDIADSVGYWYVEDLKDGWCRVYYSTDSQLPRFIPGFAKDAIVNMAAKRSTSWVDMRCNELTGNGSGGAAGVKGGGLLGLGKRKLAAMLALAVAWQRGMLPDIRLPFALPKLPFSLPKLPKLPMLAK